MTTQHVTLTTIIPNDPRNPRRADGTDTAKAVRTLAHSGYIPDGWEKGPHLWEKHIHKLRFIKAI